MIAVIDYGMGNLRSVLNAFEAVGAQAIVAKEPGVLRDAEAIVLPGVGAFGDGMRNLRDRGFVGALEEEVRDRKKPFLGLCLGMQLLARVSFEHGEHQGLGWIDASVERFPSAADGEPLRVPHVGWNDVIIHNQDGIFRGLGDREAFYFVHSYFVGIDACGVASGSCSYGLDFVASVEWENIYATQFHPEKSHKAGLGLLRNFVAIAEREGA